VGDSAARDLWIEVPALRGRGSRSAQAFLAPRQFPALAIHGDLDEYGSVEFPQAQAQDLS